MSLTKQLQGLKVGDALLTKHARTGIYTAAKRAGIQIKTEEAEDHILVTRVGKTLSKVESVLLAVEGLGVADRLKVFAAFELCCGMNRGGCICPEEELPYTRPSTHQPTGDALTDFIAKAQAKKGIEPKDYLKFGDSLQHPEPVEDWRFTKDKPEYHDNGRVYRQQALAPEFKQRRTVRVDEDDHERIIEQ